MSDPPRDEGKRAPVCKGCLYVVATPIGNLEDITYRAVRVLAEVDLIAAEDTRTARVLLSRYDLHTPTLSYYKDVEEERATQILARLKQGEAVALISEAGMPGISDPGFRLVARCLEAGLPVDVIPGPSAGLTALLLSGLPTDRFTSVGFLPRAPGARRRVLEELCDAPGSLILYEAPGRVAHTLQELRDALGDREAAVARELTKLHQEVVRGRIGELCARYGQEAPRGEVTLIVAPAPPEPELTDDELRAQVQARLERGESPRDIARTLAAHGKRRVYQLALSLKPEA
jgi:16S rRNA (cytidine1402-2'-O)-methyltransferase